MYARKATPGPATEITSTRQSERQHARNRVKTAPRLYDMKCGAQSCGHSGSGERLPIQVQLRQWPPEAVGARASEKGSHACCGMG